MPSAAEIVRQQLGQEQLSREQEEVRVEGERQAEIVRLKTEEALGLERQRYVSLRTQVLETSGVLNQLREMREAGREFSRDFDLRGYADFAYRLEWSRWETNGDYKNRHRFAIAVMAYSTGYPLSEKEGVIEIPAYTAGGMRYNDEVRFLVSKGDLTKLGFVRNGRVTKDFITIDGVPLSLEDCPKRLPKVLADAYLDPYEYRTDQSYIGPTIDISELPEPD